MGDLKRRATVVAAGVLLGLGGFVSPALAGGEHHPPPTHDRGACNAGNGNGSEEPSATCIGGDPGNSNATNRGGDEGGTPMDNPGGNNVD